MLFTLPTLFLSSPYLALLRKGHGNRFSSRAIGTLMPTMSRAHIAAWAGIVILAAGVVGFGTSPPRAESQVVYVPVGQAQSIRLLGTDPDKDPLTFEVGGPPSHGVLSGTPPELVYTPAPGFVGRDRFTFLVRDPYGAFDIGVVELRVGEPKPVVRVGPANLEGLDADLAPLAAVLAGMGVSTWYVATAPVLTCSAGGTAALVLGGWEGEARFLAFDPRGRSKLEALRWDKSKFALDVSPLAPGSYLIVVVFGKEAVSFPALVRAPGERTLLSINARSGSQ